jgi:hypothetical protein
MRNQRADMDRTRGGLALAREPAHSLSRDHFPHVHKIWAEENSDSSKRPQNPVPRQGPAEKDRPWLGQACYAGMMSVCSFLYALHVRLARKQRACRYVNTHETNGP